MEVGLFLWGGANEVGEIREVREVREIREVGEVIGITDVL